MVFEGQEIKTLRSIVRKLTKLIWSKVLQYLRIEKCFLLVKFRIVTVTFLYKLTQHKNIKSEVTSAKYKKNCL